MRTNGLETRLFSQSNFDLAEAAFIASGVDSQQKLDHYLDQLARLASEITEAIAPAEALSRGQTFFQRLWQAKPQRYQPGGDFRLHQVLTLQLNPIRNHVGNCLGLTLLYNVLGHELGLRVAAIHLEDAFGYGPHVFSLLYIGDSTIDVENVLPYGFDYQGHRHNQQRVEWGDRELVADIYLSQGNQWFALGNLELAIGCYNKALRLNPKYESASLNKSIALASPVGKFH